MQSVVKYSVNLELQIYQNLSIVSFVSSHLKQDKIFLNQLEELEFQWDLICWGVGWKLTIFLTLYFVSRKHQALLDTVFKSPLHLQWKHLQVKDLTSCSLEASLGEGVAFFHNWLISFLGKCWLPQLQLGSRKADITDTVRTQWLWWAHGFHIDTGYWWSASPRIITSCVCEANYCVWQ